MNDVYNITYNNLGKISKIKANNDIYNYNYDLSQRISSYQFNNFRINYDYDISSNVTDKHYELNDIYKHISYSYNKENTVDKITFDNNEINYIYDTLGRLKEKNINDILKTSYKYITNGNKTSFILKSLKNNDDEYKYIYDKLNNITHIYLNEELINKYKYDINNQLIEDNNFITNITTEYIYDNVGNITSKKDYELDTETLINENIYEYNNTDWEDQLTKFNNEEITYDEIGNPLTIGNTISLNWTNGRILSTYENNIENISISYKYNKDGVRTSKTINNIETKYYLENNNIIVEKGTEYVIYYIRDESNNLIGFTYENTNNPIGNGTYYYIKNAQNDIIEIVDSENNKVAKYLYDAYGNHIYIKDGNDIDVSNDLTHIANINPFRYRSYYYDNETGLYYLNNRYYNPMWGRFLNSDALVSTGQGLTGNNMYCYTGNNPINRTDTCGYLWFQAAGAVIGGLAGGAAKIVSNVSSGNKWNDGLGGAIVGGAATGLLATTPMGLKYLVISSYGGSFLESLTNEINSGDDFSIFSVAWDTTVNGTANYILGKKLNLGYTINKGWFRPQTFITSFTGNYTKKLTFNMIIDNAVDIVSAPIVEVIVPKPPVVNKPKPVVTKPSSGAGNGGGFLGGGSFIGGGGGSTGHF